MERDEDLVRRLKEALSGPLAHWDALYESFSPLDLTTGQRRPRAPESRERARRAGGGAPGRAAGAGARVASGRSGARRAASAGAGGGAGGAAVPAAVLAADSGARVVYALRTDGLPDHAGQVS